MKMMMMVVLLRLLPRLLSCQMAREQTPWRVHRPGSRNWRKKMRNCVRWPSLATALSRVRLARRHYPARRFDTRVFAPWCPRSQRRPSTTARTFQPAWRARFPRVTTPFVVSVTSTKDSRAHKSTTEASKT